MVEIRSQCLVRLVALLRDAKKKYVEAFDTYDLEDFLEYLQEPNWALDYERVSKELGVSIRTAYDYAEAIRAIARVLLDNDSSTF